MCMQLRDAMRVGNIAFSEQFFSTTQGLREVKQQLEDELRNFCIVRCSRPLPFLVHAPDLPRLRTCHEQLVEAAKTPFGARLPAPLQPSNHC